MIIKGDTYRDRSHVIMTPTRGWIHVEAYEAHLAMLTPPSVPQIRMIAAGHEVAAAYNEMFKAALNKPHGFSYRYAICLEDDMIPPPDGIERLLLAAEEHPQHALIGALYHKKNEYALPLIYGHPHNPQDMSQRPAGEGFIDCNGTGLGFAIVRLSAVETLPYPWFKTTRDTQDIYFCRRLRDRGFLVGVDCSIRCGHVDGKTGKIY